MTTLHVILSLYTAIIYIYIYISVCTVFDIIKEKLHSSMLMLFNAYCMYPCIFSSHLQANMNIHKYFVLVGIERAHDLANCLNY